MTISDLRNRTLVESNTLKSIILGAEGQSRPKLDDILIHEYQMANSITLNSIYSNYLSNLRHAWDMMEEKSDSSSSHRDWYFNIVAGKLNEDVVGRISDKTRLILNVDDGTCSFKSMKLSFVVDDMDDIDGRMVNLDQHWYIITSPNIRYD